MIRPKGIYSADAEAHHVCLRKNAYTKRIALRVARRIRRNTGEDVRAYACPYCDMHHIGHVPGCRGGRTDG